MKKGQIGIYGNRIVGFGYLASVDGESEVFGDHKFTGKMPNQDATSCLFKASDDLASRGVTKAMVCFDIKANGGTIVKSAEIDTGNPPTFGDIAWKDTFVDG